MTYFKHTKWPLIWTVFIFFVCSYPGSDLPSADWLGKLHLDKWIHAGLYAILFVLLVKAWIDQDQSQYLKKKAIHYSIAFCLLYGITIEILQTLFFEGRSGDWKDAVANTFGIVLGTLLFRLLFKKSICTYHTEKLTITPKE